MVKTEGYFYVLVLSKSSIRIFKSDAWSIVEIDIPEMPRGIADVVRLEEKDQDLFRTESNSAGGGADFHGIAEGRPYPKKNLELYFDEVDETLANTILNQEKAPMLLAGVEYLIPIYKKVSTYKFLVDDTLTGSYEHADEQEVYSAARQKMEWVFAKSATGALESYANKSATDLVSSDARSIIAAACYGRIHSLFVQRGFHVWGTFDQQNNVFKIDDQPRRDNECLVSKAIMETIHHGGSVYFVRHDDMPGRVMIAAEMRYVA